MVRKASVAISAVSEAIVEKLSSNSAITSIYGGPQIEDETYQHWVLEWASLDALQQFSAVEPKPWGDFQADAKVVQFPEITNIHIVLGAPVSEFAYARLKEPENQKKWDDCLKVTLDGMKMTKGAIAGLNGKEIGNIYQYVFIIGWESIEDHKAALSAEYAQDIYQETVTLTEFHARHARLSRRK